MSQAPVFSVQYFLSPYIWIFCLSFVLSFALTPAMGRVALALGITDAPDGRRKLHGRTMPYLGGVAMFAAWAVSLAVHYFRARQSGASAPIDFATFSGVIGGAATIAAIGLWDDAWHVRPGAKILGQAVAAMFLFASGIGARSAGPAIAWLVQTFAPACGITDPFASGAPIWFSPLAQIASFVFTAVVVIGCCNSMNLMDGLDGLCGGVAAIITMGLLSLSVYLAVARANAEHDEIRIIFALAALGAVLGFIPFNFNPASIFMGDTGSMFLGYCCAIGMVLMARVSPKWFLAATVMLALPVFDTALAFARRWIAGRSVFSADTRHFHHQLMQRGLRAWQAVVVCYAISLAFVLLGIATALVRARFAAALYLVICSFVAVAAIKMGMIHEIAVPARGRRPRSESDTLSKREVDALFDAVTDARFKTFLEFIWATGCRGADAARIRAEHVDGSTQCIRLPIAGDPSNGARLIRLNESTERKLVTLIAEHPRGRLFRDSFGASWTRDSIADQFRRLNQKLGRHHSLALLRRSRTALLTLDAIGPIGIDIGSDRPSIARRSGIAVNDDPELLDGKRRSTASSRGAVPEPSCMRER